MNWTGIETFYFMFLPGVVTSIQHLVWLRGLVQKINLGNLTFSTRHRTELPENSNNYDIRFDGEKWPKCENIYYFPATQSIFFSIDNILFSELVKGFWLSLGFIQLTSPLRRTHIPSMSINFEKWWICLSWKHKFFVGQNEPLPPSYLHSSCFLKNCWILCSATTTLLFIYPIPQTQVNYYSVKCPPTEEVI